MGHTQEHHRGIAGKRWKKRAPEKARMFKVNLQKVTLKFADGEEKQTRICTKCLKRIKKFHEIKDYKNISVA
jgi:ribosomal protein L28